MRAARATIATAAAIAHRLSTHGLRLVTIRVGIAARRLGVAGHARSAPSSLNSRSSASSSATGHPLDASAQARQRAREPRFDCALGNPERGCRLLAAELEEV